MRRILLVLRGAIDVALLARRCEELAGAVAGGGEVALCYELAPGHDSLSDGLAAQRTLTRALRAASGACAEQMAVFVASDRDGERLADCAQAWGATEVVG